MNVIVVCNWWHRSTVFDVCVSRQQYLLMFSKPANSTNPTESSVVLIKESYWNTLDVVKQNNNLFICKPKTNVSTELSVENDSQYEIIYNNLKMFSLCRIKGLQTASNRFNCLQSILSFVSQRTNPYRRTAFTIKSLQKVIDTMTEHSNWLDVHVAAYNGFVDFFRKTQLSQNELNAQVLPDLCTPLHISIQQGFKDLTETIISLKANINLLDCDNNSILHYAVTSKQEILDLVLTIPNLRPLFNVKNNKNLRPVEVSCYNMRRDNLRQLISYGLTPQMLTMVDLSKQDLCSFQARLDNNRVVNFDKNDIDELDFNSINLGGCPIHWALTPRLIEKLIIYFNIDTPNLNGETPLIVMIKKNRFRCILSLLFNGANVNKCESNGDLPLHIAVQTANITLVKTLIIFDANFDAVNAKNESPRHLSAIGKHPNHKDILEIFNSIGAKPCSQTIKSKCSSSCSIKLDQPVEDLSFSSLQDSDDQYSIHYGYHHRQMANAILNKCKQKSTSRILSEITDSNVSKYYSSLNQSDKLNKKVRLISFDGGGVKGLFTVQMMIELTKYLKHDLINYFDWICGTSTGAMIAFGLSQGRSLTQLRKLYFIFKDKILTGNRPYSAENLEKLFRDELGANISMQDVLTTYHKHMIITATRVDHHPPTLQLFRSYSYPKNASNKDDNEKSIGQKANKDNNTSVAVWQALRASSAAPTFFRSYPPYIDGGMVCNNPTLDCLAEFCRYQNHIKKYNEKHDEKLPVPELELVLSFGTGQLKSQKKDLSNVYNKFYYFLNLRSSFRDINRSPWVFLTELVSQVKAQVTNCNDHVVLRSDSWCSSLNTIFYRFNAVMSKKISLNETNDHDMIFGLWEVKIYAYKMASELKKMAQVMDYLYAEST